MAVPIEKILDEARFAPSGDNLQPWLFKVHSESHIALYKSVPENVTEPAYFFTGTSRGLGCIVENVVIAALHFGYSAEITLSEEMDTDSDFIADIRFTPGVFSPQEKEDNEKLFLVMRARRTDRRHYQKKSLSDATKQRLAATALQAGGRLYFVEGEKRLRRFGKAITAQDDYFWTDALLRDNLIKTIHFSRQDQAASSGMPLPTLGLGWLGVFSKMTFLLAYRMDWLWKIVSWQSKVAMRKTYTASGALMFLTLPQQSRIKPYQGGWCWQDSFQGGRIAERLWLSATAEGLSLQPQYAYVGMADNKGNESLGPVFAEANRQIMIFLSSEFPWLASETLVFAFRVGYPLSARPAPGSPRKKVEDIVWRS